jgi:hypothetical protein
MPQFPKMNKTRMIKTMGIKPVPLLFANSFRVWSGVVLILLLCSSNSFGQLKVRTLPRDAGNHAARSNAGSRTKELPPLPLPFFDDFSRPFVHEGNLYPDLGRWDSSYSVWINTGMAINAPTINVATFDGLDSAGLAYNPNEIFLNGFTDSLVSQKIAMDSVPEGERNSVYISFFYQWRGNGESPDDEDYLELLFMNDQEEWESALVIPTDPAFQRDLFYTAIVQVAGTQFFHNAFQFQIRTFGRQAGPYDTWNVDYVYLNKNRTATDLSFPDRAAASAVSPLFNPYSAMPYYHFLTMKNLDQVQFDVQNLKSDTAATNYSADIEYTSFTDGVSSSFAKNLVTAASVTGGLGIPSNGRARVELGTMPDANNPMEFDPAADSVDITMKMTVLSGDEEDDLKSDFPGIDFRINDTLTTNFYLRNFYAYDDGTAEYAVELIETGNFLAYEFNLSPALHDTLKVLKAIDIYFPPYGLPGTQNVDFYVFAQNTARGVPGARLLTIPSYRIDSKGPNRFQRIKFLPALSLDTVETFYIGWKQPIAGDVLVGLDNSNDTGNKIFVNIEGNNIPNEKNAVWDQNTTFQGSLMIRPVFTTGFVDPTTGIEDEVKFSIYPNPSGGNFYIEGPMDDLEILSVTGQRVTFHMEPGPDKTFVQLNSVSSGLYLVRCTRSGVVRTQKIIVTR